MVGVSVQRLEELQRGGLGRVIQADGSAWEQITFGIESLDPALPPFFTTREVRQAVALCIDRPALTANQPVRPEPLPAAFLPSAGLAATGGEPYTQDSAAAGALLEAAGWVDDDANPQTPRRARGAAGVADGTPFRFEYLAAAGAASEQAARQIVADLGRCGLQAELRLLPEAELFAAGPDGVVFGRHFQAAQFAWEMAWLPACDLYISRQIPGAPPEAPLGWGGANAGGYRNAEFDALCRQTQSAMQDSAAWSGVWQNTQSLFGEELPVLPLYLRSRWIVVRPGLCGVELGALSQTGLWSLESIRAGPDC
jgi:ABC-type transport system substrate-binding protein